MNHDTVSAFDELRDKPLRVAAFCRTTADANETWLPRVFYSNLVASCPNWKFFGCYGGQKSIDKSEQCLGGLPQLITDCKSNKIDLIITKSFSTLKRNVTACLSIIHGLKRLNPPVGVYFETEDFYTLHSNSDIYLSLFQALADLESENKSKGIRCLISSHDVNVLKRAREAKGMTQQQVADKAVISIRHYQQFEYGKRNLLNASFRITMAVCFALDIDPDSLRLSDSIFLDRRR